MDIMIKRLKLLILIIGVLSVLKAGAETYCVSVGQFEKLKVNGNINVVYKNLPDSTGYASYEAPEGSKDIFVFTTKGDGNLKVEPSDDKWGNKNLPVLYLYSDFLSSVESYSDQTVELSRITPCASLNISLIGNGIINVDNVKCNNLTAAITTGNGTIYLSGKCLNATLRMVGAGLISADQLQAENVKCRILGTGSIGCWPIDNLNITGLGTTKIYYKGNPNIKKTGGGKIFELPDEFDEDNYSKSGVAVPSLNLPAEDVQGNSQKENEEDNYQTVVTEDD